MRAWKMQTLRRFLFNGSAECVAFHIVSGWRTDEDRDAAFSMYFLLGFISQPFWVLVTGYLMDKTGFATALTLLSVTYIVGIFILSFLKDERSTAMNPAA